MHAALSLVSKHLPGCVSHALQEGEEIVSGVRQEPKAAGHPGLSSKDHRPPSSDTLAVLQGKAPADAQHGDVHSLWLSTLGTKGRMMVGDLDFQPWCELTFSENPAVSEQCSLTCFQKANWEL